MAFYYERNSQLKTSLDQLSNLFLSFCQLISGFNSSRIVKNRAQ